MHAKEDKYFHSGKRAVSRSEHIVSENVPIGFVWLRIVFVALFLPLSLSPQDWFALQPSETRTLTAGKGCAVLVSTRSYPIGRRAVVCSLALTMIGSNARVWAWLLLRGAPIGRRECACRLPSQWLARCRVTQKNERMPRIKGRINPNSHTKKYAM